MSQSINTSTDSPFPFTTNQETPPDLELQPPPNTTITFPSETSNLPPIDGGFLAWRMLMSFFVFEALMWGFPLSFGVFQAYYATLPAFTTNRYISIVGTTASGISYLGAPFIIPLIRRYARHRRLMILIGWPICILSLLAGSFANTLGTLILTQGVGYGVGFLIFYYPILTMMDEFWVARRGMAYGVVCSATGVSGAVMPLILQTLLKRYGYKITLRVVAVALVVATGPLIPLLKGRVPESRRQRNESPRTDWSFMKKGLFWVYSVSNVFMGLGYFFPSLYLPSYATAVGLSNTNGALLLTLLSIAQVGGQFTFGYLSDRKLPLNALVVVAATVAAIATLSVWGTAGELWLLVVFALLFGFFGAGYTPLWARMVTAVTEEPSAYQAMYSLFCFGKGVGNVLAGPISAGLLKASAGTGGGGYGHGMYRAIVVFTGVSLLFSAGTLSVIYCRPKKWLLS